MGAAAQYRLAIDFGAVCGWALTTRDFGLRTLAEGKAHDGGQRYMMGGRAKNPSIGDFPDQFDHPYFYRRNRKAAAIAAHLYNYPANKAECEKLAADYGLDFEVLDFPSWWNPGGTILVVYIGPAGRKSGTHPKVGCLVITINLQEKLAPLAQTPPLFHTTDPPDKSASDPASTKSTAASGSDALTLKGQDFPIA